MWVNGQFSHKKNIFSRFAKDGKEKDNILQKLAKQQAVELVKLAEMTAVELVKGQKKKSDELVKIAENVRVQLQKHLAIQADGLIKIAENEASFIIQTAKDTAHKLKQDAKNADVDSMTNCECGSSFPKEYKRCPSCGVSNRDIR